jgi:hypothetical protein
MTKRKQKTPAPIDIPLGDVTKELENHKNRMFGLIDDPKFRSFWTMMGGTTEQLESGREEIEKWKVKK